MVWGSNLVVLSALRSVQLSLQNSGKATSRSDYWQQGKGRSCVEEKYFHGPGYDVKDSFRTGKCMTPKPLPSRCPRMVYPASQQNLGPSYFCSALPDPQQPSLEPRRALSPAISSRAECLGACTATTDGSTKSAVCCVASDESAPGEIPWLLPELQLQ